MELQRWLWYFSFVENSLKILLIGVLQVTIPKTHEIGDFSVISYDSRCSSCAARKENDSRYFLHFLIGVVILSETYSEWWHVILYVQTYIELCSVLILSILQ